MSGQCQHDIQRDSCAICSAPLIEMARAIEKGGDGPRRFTKSIPAFTTPRPEHLPVAGGEREKPDPRLAEWGYATLDEALTHLGTLLEDQAAFDGLAAADLQKMQIGEEREQRTTAETGG